MNPYFDISNVTWDEYKQLGRFRRQAVYHSLCRKALRKPPAVIEPAHTPMQEPSLTH